MAATVGAILLVGITFYAVLGGADFGGGLWDLLAGGTTRGWAPRRLIDESITPVWEANHVWLIFDLVIFWTAFPQAFASVMTAAALPLWLAVGGVVLRGAGFAFRKEITDLRLLRVAGGTFALSSLVTPFFMGTVVGAVATGGVPADARHAEQSSWTNATSLLIGFLFVAACAYLAAVYLTGEASGSGDRKLRIYFARRAEAAAVVAGGLSLSLLAELHHSNRLLYDRLTGRSLPLKNRRRPLWAAHHRLVARSVAQTQRIAGRRCSRRSRGHLGLGRRAVPRPTTWHLGDSHHRRRPPVDNGCSIRTVPRRSRSANPLVRPLVHAANGG